MKKLSINFKGGIVYPEQMKTLMQLLKRNGVGKIILGERQNFIFNIHKDVSGNLINQLVQERISFDNEPFIYNNLVSSYAAVDLFAGNLWLNESIFKEALDNFEKNYRVKINLVDISQGLISVFDGDLIFIPSEHNNFWYLFIRNPFNYELHCWYELIYTLDLGRIADEIERILITGKDLVLENIFNEVKSGIFYINQVKEKELLIPRYIPVNYEGIHRNGNRSWIGIKNRSSRYTPDFLEGLANICIETGIKNINISTWKSFLIKNINESDLIKWEIFFGKTGINIRHSSIELNWKTSEDEAGSEKIKKYLIKKFDKIDLRTYGISFAIESGLTKNFSASIKIEIEYLLKKFKLFPRFSLFHTADFNPNNPKLLFFSTAKSKRNLFNKLVSICSKYYSQLERDQIASDTIRKVPTETAKTYWTPQRVHRCKNCLTVYDKEFGDKINDIPPGIPFEELPDDFTCYLCGAPKIDFVTVRKKILKHEDKSKETTI